MNWRLLFFSTLTILINSPRLIAQNTNSKVKSVENQKFNTLVSELPQYLPKNFIGSFTGKLEIHTNNTNVNEFKPNVQLSIYPTSISASNPSNQTPKNRYKSPYLPTNNTYQFTLLYEENGNKDFRNYTLHVTNSSKGIGFIDEQNGILIPYAISGNKLITNFTVANSQVTMVFTFSEWMVQMETFTGSTTFTSGDTVVAALPKTKNPTQQENIPLVKSTLLNTYQTATLIRQQEPTVPQGKLIQYGYFPSKYLNPHRVAVWLPPNYQSFSNTPVIYMHDGQMLFDSSTTWNHQEWGIDELLSRRNPNAIVVGIWNDGPNRSGDYFPQKVWDNYLSEADKDSIITVTKGLIPLFGSYATANSDNYLKFIVQELKPFIDTMFRPATDPSNTIIAGASMGGLISWYAMCEYPNVFGKAICLSTHWPGTSHLKYPKTPKAFENYLAKNLPSPKNHSIYFAHGTGYLDSLYTPHQKSIDKLMTKKGFKEGKNWKTKVYMGADHKESEWRKQMVDALNFMLPQQTKS
jgi:enterochelin esterase-like enzyme